MATEAHPDPVALREGRRARLFGAMEDHDLDVLVLGRVANIRYATGVPVLWNAGSRPFGPGAVVVRATRELYLLSTWDEGVPEEIPHDHLFGITWNPMGYVAVLQGIAEANQPRRVGTDAMSPLFAQLLPMAFGDAEILDGSAALRRARRVKTLEEVDAIRSAVAVADGALAAAVAALRPGADARALTGVFMDAMASSGVTTPATQDVVRITGDLATFDAGVVADGYAGEVGRTWPVDAAVDRPALGDLHGRWARLRAGLLEACRPGAPGSALLDAYDAAGEPLPAAPVGRGLGLGFDDPVIVGALPETAAAERLDPGVVLVVTATVCDPAIGSLTTHEPVLITSNGPELLSSSPIWDPEHAGARP